LIVESALGTSVPPSTIRWVLLVAVLAGMLTSTIQRDSFRVDWRPRRAWFMNFGGGMLMGFGTALAPGGNDVLVMYGIPTLSPYALPTYLALGLGVAFGLLLLRTIFGFEARAEFRDDVLISDSWTRPIPSGLNRTTGLSH
jgi:Sulphur transport